MNQLEVEANISTKLALSAGKSVLASDDWFGFFI